MKTTYIAPELFTDISNCKDMELLTNNYSKEHVNSYFDMTWDMEKKQRGYCFDTNYHIRKEREKLSKITETQIEGNSCKIFIKNDFRLSVPLSSSCEFVQFLIQNIKKKIAR